MVLAVSEGYAFLRSGFGVMVPADTEGCLFKAGVRGYGFVGDRRAPF